MAFPDPAAPARIHVRLDRMADRMRDVTIVGAGDLGGALAQTLARLDVVSAIHLVDERGGVAAGKALDITQAAAVEGFCTRVTGSADLASTAFADLVVLADRAGVGEWCGEDARVLLDRMARATMDRIIVCAGASQRDIIEYGVRGGRLPRRSLMGSAPEALSAAGRALVALATDGSPADVALAVLGVPPADIVVPWEDASVRGVAVTRLLDAATQRLVAARLAAMWPPGPLALAAAAAKVVTAIVGRSRRVPICFVGPDDQHGQRARTCALPVRLGATGIVAVELPALTVHDQVALDNAMLL